MHGQGNSTREELDSSTQRSLILRLRDWRDRRSWNEFYRNYHKLVYAVARQSGLNESEAWDVVQETFITIARQSAGGSYYDPQRGSFKSWLLHITNWRIMDALRRRGRTAEDPLRSNLPDAQEQSFERLWENEWQQNLMRTAISRVKLKVSPRQFQIYDYHVLQGMDAQEVCRRLGVNSAQVYLAKHRVGTQLRWEISELRRGEG